jgi:glucan phosphoethanolaminetransferase (alkaline phosphatase superfamily)
MCTFGGNLNLYAMKEKIRQALRICLLFAILLIPIFYALCTAIDLEYSFLKKMAYLWVVVILLLLPTLFVKARTYFIIEGIFNLLFFPIDIASLYLNRQSTSRAFLQNILNTDLQEAGELLVSIWPVCGLVLAIYVTYFALAWRVENTFLLPKRWRKVVLIGGIFAVATGIVTYSIYNCSRRSNQSIGTLLLSAIDTAAMKLYKIFPYNLYLEMADIVAIHHQQQKLQEQVAHFTFGITPTQQDNALYILVLGEAVRYDHLGIHGYALNTTPYLAQQSNLISYDSAFAQANLTANSLPLILSRATADDPNRAFREKSIVAAFEEAGIVSGYITKQQPTAIERRILSSCHYPYAYSKDFDVDGNYDAEMIDQLRAYVADTAQFFVLHMLGSHFRYELRYPACFEVFKPVMGKSFSYSMINKSNKDKFVNAYNNTLLYLDYFMHELITYVDSLNKPAVIVYLSDHGESFWDDEQNLSLHGSYSIAKSEFHVPMLIWYSDQYAAAYPQKVENLKQNKTRAVSSNVVFSSMLDMAGVTEVVDSTKSICSPCLQSIDSLWVMDGTGNAEHVSLKELNK